MSTTRRDRPVDADISIVTVGSVTPARTARINSTPS